MLQWGAIYSIFFQIVTIHPVSLANQRSGQDCSKGFCNGVQFILYIFTWSPFTQFLSQTKDWDKITVKGTYPRYYMVRLNLKLHDRKANIFNSQSYQLTIHWQEYIPTHNTTEQCDWLYITERCDWSPTILVDKGTAVYMELISIVQFIAKHYILCNNKTVLCFDSEYLCGRPSKWKQQPNFLLL